MGADWDTLAVIHILLGFEADVFGLIKFGGGDDDTKALLIIAFLLYILAAMLVALMKLANLQRNIIISIVTIAALIIAGLFIIIGVGIYGDGNKANPYAATLECTAALMAFLGSTFLLLNMLCGGGNKTGSAA